MQQAVDFLKVQAESITKLLTKTHHNILQGFIQFKARNDKLIRERETMYACWLYSERALALKTPVREAEFALDDQSALRMYDCLLPLLKEHRRLRVVPDSEPSTTDYLARMKVLELECQLRSKNQPQLIKENG